MLEGEGTGSRETAGGPPVGGAARSRERGGGREPKPAEVFDRLPGLCYIAQVFRVREGQPIPGVRASSIPLWPASAAASGRVD